MAERSVSVTDGTLRKDVENLESIARNLQAEIEVLELNKMKMSEESLRVNKLIEQYEHIIRNMHEDDSKPRDLHPLSRDSHPSSPKKPTNDSPRSRSKSVGHQLNDGIVEPLDLTKKWHCKIDGKDGKGGKDGKDSKQASSRVISDFEKQFKVMKRTNSIVVPPPPDIGPLVTTRRILENKRKINIPLPKSSFINQMQRSILGNKASVEKRPLSTRIVQPIRSRNQTPSSSTANLRLESKLESKKPSLKQLNTLSPEKVTSNININQDQNVDQVELILSSDKFKQMLSTQIKSMTELQLQENLDHLVQKPSILKGILNSEDRIDQAQNRGARDGSLTKRQLNSLTELQMSDNIENLVQKPSILKSVLNSEDKFALGQDKAASDVLLSKKFLLGRENTLERETYSRVLIEANVDLISPKKSVRLFQERKTPRDSDKEEFEPILDDSVKALRSSDGHEIEYSSGVVGVVKNSVDQTSQTSPKKNVADDLEKDLKNSEGYISEFSDVKVKAVQNGVNESSQTSSRKDSAENARIEPMGKEEIERIPSHFVQEPLFTKKEDLEVISPHKTLIVQQRKKEFEDKNTQNNVHQNEELHKNLVGVQVKTVLSKQNQDKHASHFEDKSDGKSKLSARKEQDAPKQNVHDVDRHQRKNMDGSEEGKTQLKHNKASGNHSDKENDENTESFKIDEMEGTTNRDMHNHKGCMNKKEEVNDSVTICRDDSVNEKKKGVDKCCGYSDEESRLGDNVKKTGSANRPVNWKDNEDFRGKERLDKNEGKTGEDYQEKISLDEELKKRRKENEKTKSKNEEDMEKIGCCYVGSSIVDAACDRDVASKKHLSNESQPASKRNFSCQCCPGEPACDQGKFKRENEKRESLLSLVDAENVSDYSDEHSEGNNGRRGFYKKREAGRNKRSKKHASDETLLSDDLLLEKKSSRGKANGRSLKTQRKTKSKTLFADKESQAPVDAKSVNSNGSHLSDDDEKPGNRGRSCLPMLKKKKDKEMVAKKEGAPKKGASNKELYAQQRQDESRGRNGHDKMRRKEGGLREQRQDKNRRVETPRGKQKQMPRDNSRNKNKGRTNSGRKKMANKSSGEEGSYNYDDDDDDSMIESDHDGGGEDDDDAELQEQGKYKSCNKGIAFACVDSKGKYIKLQNVSKEAINIGGYYLLQLSNNAPYAVFRFPDDVIIMSDCLITVWSGINPPCKDCPPGDFLFKSRLYWSTGPGSETILTQPDPRACNFDGPKPATCDPCNRSNKCRPPQPKSCLETQPKSSISPPKCCPVQPPNCCPTAPPKCSVSPPKSCPVQPPSCCPTAPPKCSASQPKCCPPKCCANVPNGCPVRYASETSVSCAASMQHRVAQLVDGCSDECSPRSLISCMQKKKCDPGCIAKVSRFNKKIMALCCDEDCACGTDRSSFGAKCFNAKCYEPGPGQDLIDIICDKTKKRKSPYDLDSLLYFPQKKVGKYSYNYDPGKFCSKCYDTCKDCSKAKVSSEKQGWFGWLNWLKLGNKNANSATDCDHVSPRQIYRKITPRSKSCRHKTNHGDKAKQHPVFPSLSDGSLFPSHCARDADDLSFAAVSILAVACTAAAIYKSK